MKVNLTHILQNNGLFSGYSFRTKVENDPNGDVAVVQMKDLKDGYSNIATSMIKVLSSSIPEKYNLQKGDVLFISKGYNNFALVYDLDLQKAVASSAFFVLRPDRSKVVPEYLAWYLNQKPIQQYIKDNRAGTYIPNVNKTTLESIQMRLPEKKLQEKIVKIDFLRKREYLLTNQLLSKRELLVSYKLLNAIND